MGKSAQPRKRVKSNTPSRPAKKGAKPPVELSAETLAYSAPLGVRKGKGKRSQQPAPRKGAPGEDGQLAVEGIPDEAEIAEELKALDAGALRAYRRVHGLLADHLGSQAAARLWLVTPSPGFETTPLAALRQGHAKLMLEMLESQLGPSPSYA